MPVRGVINCKEYRYTEGEQRRNEQKVRDLKRRLISFSQLSHFTDDEWQMRFQSGRVVYVNRKKIAVREDYESVYFRNPYALLCYLESFQEGHPEEMSDPFKSTGDNDFELIEKEETALEQIETVGPWMAGFITTIEDPLYEEMNIRELLHYTLDCYLDSSEANKLTKKPTPEVWAEILEQYKAAHA